MKYIYRVTNDHGYSSVYFEAENDAEEYLGQFTAADGMHIDVIFVIPAAHPTPLAADLLEPAQECECDPSQEYYIHCPIHGNATR